MKNLLGANCGRCKYPHNNLDTCGKASAKSETDMSELGQTLELANSFISITMHFCRRCLFDPRPDT